MKNFQIRLSEEVHAAVSEIAEERSSSIAEVIRDAIETFAISCVYAREGRRLVWENPETGERTEVLMPGLALHQLRPKSRQTVATGA
jgi:hypothetical protein